jgi:hypothetical protein
LAKHLLGGARAFRLIRVAEVFDDIEYNILTRRHRREMTSEIARIQRRDRPSSIGFSSTRGNVRVDLATAMTLERPQLKALPMCGFPEGMLVLNEGWHFLS